ARVKGLIINKFRGDASILDSGIKMLEEKGGVKVAGLVPYMDISLDDEDSLSGRLVNKAGALIDIAVIKYPRISNFTDFNVFDEYDEVSVRYVTSVSELGTPDLVIFPGSKNTMGDLKWLRSSGLEASIIKMSGKTPVIGICGGYQMLGISIRDPESVEEGGQIKGMGLLPVYTVLKNEKTRKQVTGTLDDVAGIFAGLSSKSFEGYEIHMGETSYDEDGEKPVLNNIICDNNIYGTYIHGFFDDAGISSVITESIAADKNIDLKDFKGIDYKSFKESQYDKLADMLRLHMDMEYIYGILGDSGI
ncbi:MAG: cobyric acid synthase, partial [Lachnospiraceae bacterium]|nr:cobyric acid synthase [Lachnospiraceae bacterium]